MYVIATEREMPSSLGNVGGSEKSQ